MSSETIVAAGTFLGAFIGALLLALRSQRTTTKTTIQDEFSKYSKAQAEASDRLNQTFEKIIHLQENQLEDYKRDLAELRANAGNFKAALDDALKDAEIIRRDMHDLQCEVDKLRIENADKEKQLAALTKAIQQREDLIGSHVQKIDRLERALADKDEQLTEAQATITTLKQNEAKTAGELSELRERVKKLELEVAKLNQERDQLIVERDAARREAEQARAEAAAAKAREVELTRRIELLESQIRTLQAAKAAALPAASEGTG